MNNPKIKVVLVDDHQIFRTGLLASIHLFDDLEVLVDLPSGEAAIEWLRTAKQLPDVILMDMKMKAMDGAETTAVVKEKYRNVKIIGLSVYESHSHVVSMFKAGAGGYLLKDSQPEEIAEAIREVYHNEYYFSQNISIKLLKSILDKDVLKANKAKNPEDLNEQELSLLKHICNEHTNAEIAELMHLGVKTIENYRNRLLQKTGSRNTAGLVVYAIKKGYIIV